MGFSHPLTLIFLLCIFVSRVPTRNTQSKERGGSTPKAPSSSSTQPPIHSSQQFSTSKYTNTTSSHLQERRNKKEQETTSKRTSVSALRQRKTMVPTLLLQSLRLPAIQTKKERKKWPKHAPPTLPSHLVALATSHLVLNPLQSPSVYPPPVDQNPGAKKQDPTPALTD